MVKFLLVFLLVISLHAQLQGGSGGWSASKLPEMALGIVAHQGELWVVGANEMVAESKDGGQTWKLRHRNRGGEMLFSLSFATDKVVYAMGSGGVLLESGNGGHSWQSDKQSYSIRRIAFVDANHGFALAHDLLLATEDAGRTWHGANLQGPRAKAWLAADRSRGDQGWHLVALDARHALAAYGTRLAFTEDGGSQWKLARLPGGTMLDGVRVEAGQYVLDSSDADNNGKLFQFKSSDGSTWTEETPPATRFTDCVGLFCLTQDGWADLSGGSPAYFRLPETNHLQVAWAVVGAAYCEVGSELWCATGEREDVPEVVPASTEPTEPRATATDDPSYSGAAFKRREQGSVDVLIRIGAQGQVQEAQLREASYSALGLMALGAVHHWKFEPARQAGKPVKVNAVLEFNFSLYR